MKLNCYFDPFSRYFILRKLFFPPLLNQNPHCNCWFAGSVCMRVCEQMCMNQQKNENFYAQQFNIAFRSSASINAVCLIVGLSRAKKKIKENEKEWLTFYSKNWWKLYGFSFFASAWMMAILFVCSECH